VPFRILRIWWEMRWWRSRRSLESTIEEVPRQTNLLALNAPLRQLDQVIQSNASGSEQLASLSEESSAQARAMQRALAFFKTDAGSNPWMPCPLRIRNIELVLMLSEIELSLVIIPYP